MRAPRRGDDEGDPTHHHERERQIPRPVLSTAASRSPLTSTTAQRGDGPDDTFAEADRERAVSAMGACSRRRPRRLFSAMTGPDSSTTTSSSDVIAAGPQRKSMSATATQPICATQIATA